MNLVKTLLAESPVSPAPDSPQARQFVLTAELLPVGGNDLEDKGVTVGVLDIVFTGNTEGRFKFYQEIEDAIKAVCKRHRAKLDIAR